MDEAFLDLDLEQNTYAIENAQEGTSWPTTRVNTWVLVKIAAYTLCVLSFFDAVINLWTIVSWACHGDWAAFTVSVIFMSLVSCVTGLIGAVGDHQSSSSADRASDRGILDSDGGKVGAVLAFFKLGAFRIAYRTLWYLDRAEILAAAGTWHDEDLCEHMLPLFMYVTVQALVESWPILLIKCYVLGYNRGSTGPGGSVADDPLLAISVGATVALLAAIPTFVDKISCDFRQVYVRGTRATALGVRFLGFTRCFLLFLLRYTEAISWYLSLVVFAWAFKGWFWMLWAADLIALSCIFCITADVREEDWEVAVVIKVLFQVFYTAPHHSEDSDVVVFFRQRGETRFFQQPTLFPVTVHFIWRLIQQGVILLCVFTAGRHNWLDDDEWEGLQPWLLATAVTTAIMWIMLWIMLWIMPTSEVIIAGIEERKYLLQSRRPEGVSEELYNAVLHQRVESYAELVNGEPYSIRSWLLYEHAARNQQPGTDRLSMNLSREAIVHDVLEQVASATRAQLRRGPKVVFSERGEIGDDQGGLTREMFAAFSREILNENRLFQSSESNRAYPAYFVDESQNQHYYAVGRLCAMALWTRQLLDINFAPFFLKRVIDSNAIYSLDENLTDLAEEDVILHRSMSSLLALENPAGTEDLGLTFEMTVEYRDQPPQVMPLVDGGSQILITPANARTYVTKYLEHRMSTLILPQAKAFRDGLVDVLGEPVLLTNFTAEELQRMLGGTDAITSEHLERWKKSSVLADGTSSNATVVTFFWQSLERMTESERGNVLSFATGCPRLPLGTRGAKFVINLHPHEVGETLYWFHLVISVLANWTFFK
jgi:hypothetical protein